MLCCPSCTASIPAGSRFCGSCGAAVPDTGGPATQTSLDGALSPTVPSPDSGPPSSAPSHPSLDQARFLPGSMLAGRYRIVALLGRGGMGEVYRADDLKLGQPVALKFLPEGLEREPARLARFLEEVRLARQVSHGNVCRVYDVGETDGQHFLSMEYVDGEDLASLLRRIGRLPRDKALQVARQLCAGLAAAHEQGILHRDLKPANVMIDGRGRVKVTDFGLASLEDSVGGVEARSGTPAYMAPEQLAGRQATQRSDLYSLGLVLYELFTGRPAFEAATPADLARLQSESKPATPSSLVEGIDSTVERVILRCLEREPADRPASALAVAAALPGGDPLAAALAAGETPSPEMVAAAGGVGGLRPGAAMALLAVVLLGVAGSLLVTGRLSLTGRVPFEKPPAELSLAARQIVKAAGYDEQAVGRMHGFAIDADYIRHVEDGDSSPGRWDRLGSVQPSPVTFWYRQSPRHLVPLDSLGGVSPDDPPETVSGMIGVQLDSRGRLTRFLAVPPQLEEPAPPQGEADWSAMFEAAGLDPAGWTPAPPSWNPLVDCDSRMAWTGAYDGQPDVGMRIEAGSHAGRPVYFEIIPPWRRPARMETRARSAGDRAAQIVGVSIMLAVLLGAVLLARRNIRLGRGDRKGAFRLAGFVFFVQLVSFLASQSHVPAFSEVSLILQTVAWSLLSAGFGWLIYMALEPYVRKLWPDSIISWSRLIEGRFRDPLVGRHALIGAALGIVASLYFMLNTVAPGLLGLPGEIWSFPVRVLASPLRAVEAYADALLEALLIPIVLLLLLLLLRVVLRRQWAASVAFLLIFVLPGSLAGGLAPHIVIGRTLFSVLVLFVLLRMGLVPLMFMILFSQWLNLTPAADLTAWHAGRSLLALIVFSAIAIYAFTVALAGRPVFSESLLEPERRPSGAS